MVDVIAVEVIGHRTVHLWFDDGCERIVGLEPLLSGPAFEEIARSDDVFRSVRVDAEAGTIVWPNGADLAPEVLHGDHEPASRSLTDEETCALADEVATTEYDVEDLRRRAWTPAEIIARQDEIAKRFEDFDPAEAVEIPVEEYLRRRMMREDRRGRPAGS